jgi:hypothetical protein
MAEFAMGRSELLLGRQGAVPLLIDSSGAEEGVELVDVSGQSNLTPDPAACVDLSPSGIRNRITLIKRGETAG